MSPRPTSKELKMAKEKEQLRQQRIVRKQVIKTKIKLKQIESELDGLYQELDKICKKAPQEEISDLTVENANQLIKDTKEIMKEDPYIELIKEFVPAGDNPEYRDAIVVLRQLKNGLARFNKGYVEYEDLGDLIIELQELESEEE